MHLGSPLPRSDQRIERGGAEYRGLEGILLEGLGRRDLDVLFLGELGNADRDAQRLARLAAIVDSDETGLVDIEAGKEPLRRIPGDERATRGRVAREARLLLGIQISATEHISGSAHDQHGQRHCQPKISPTHPPLQNEPGARPPSDEYPVEMWVCGADTSPIPEAAYHRVRRNRKRHEPIVPRGMSAAIGSSVFG